jgi:hypothetical protein
MTPPKKAAHHHRANVQLKKGAKFYPFVSGSKVVCVQPVAVNGKGSLGVLPQNLGSIWFYDAAESWCV